MFFSENHEAQS